MIALIQRVSEASVAIDDGTTQSIGRGLLILLGIRNGDVEDFTKKLAKKTASLRIFPDINGKMNLSLADINGEALVISQFTLCADIKKGNRPSFVDAAPPEKSFPLYEAYVSDLSAALGKGRVKTGKFGANMKVSLVNDGPVTITLTMDAKTP